MACSGPVQSRPLVNVQRSGSENKVDTDCAPRPLHPSARTAGAGEETWRAGRLSMGKAAARPLEMGKPWKGRGHPSRDKSPQVPSWLSATFEESSESPFSRWFYLVTAEGRELQPIILHPTLDSQRKCGLSDCPSGLVTRTGGSLGHNPKGHLPKPTERKACSAAEGASMQEAGGPEPKVLLQIPRAPPPAPNTEHRGMQGHREKDLPGHPGDVGSELGLVQGRPVKAVSSR